MNKVNFFKKKINLKLTLKKLLVLFLFSQNCYIGSAFAGKGISSGGGGDEYTIDFLNSLKTDMLPWLEANKSFISSNISLKAISDLVNDDELPEKIESASIVYESCDETENGRMVAVCYNYVTNKFKVSRSMYPKDVRRSLSKNLLLLHEILRPLKKEGDDYKETRRISMNVVNPEQMSECMINLYLNANFKSSKLKSKSIQFCEVSGADQNTQTCVKELVLNSKFIDDKSKELAADMCQASLGEKTFLNTVINTLQRMSINNYEERLEVIKGLLKVKFEK